WTWNGHSSRMKIKKRKPCSICRKWFTPHSRLGSRQRTCGSEACRAEQGRRTQASWRRRNPDYFVGRRVQARLAKAEAAKKAKQRSVLPPPSFYRALPLDIAQEAIGVKGLVFLAYFGRLLRRDAQNLMRAELAGMREEFSGLLHSDGQDPMSRPTSEVQAAGDPEETGGRRSRQ
ncbi:MAG: hypothetical protein QME77_13025, partial [bacterium]|nr:hypothetical protein [bacterium]